MISICYRSRRPQVRQAARRQEATLRVKLALVEIYQNPHGALCKSCVAKVPPIVVTSSSMLLCIQPEHLGSGAPVAHRAALAYRSRQGNQAGHTPLCIFPVAWYTELVSAAAAENRSGLGTYSKKAFLTGITGQDGAYLSPFLLEKDYQVYGLVRRSSTSDVNDTSLRRLGIVNDLHLIDGDVTDLSSLILIVSDVRLLCAASSS